MEEIQNCSIIPFSLNPDAIRYVVGGGLALSVAIYLNREIRDFKKIRALSCVRKRKQMERREKFKLLQAEFPLTNECEEIIGLPFDVLVERLQRRELTARKVLSAFVAKTLAVTNEFNCVTEFCPKMTEWADELDRLPSVRGPLHGLPICIKDDFNIAGMDSTLGFSKNLYKPATESSVVVRILQEAGAVPFCKTNVPQSLFSTSSHNPIFGTTSNHLNKELSPGGSSSGTGCLVGAGGAVFGTGSDIAGSLRIPAHFNGISALRPTTGRISEKGIVKTLALSAGYTVVPGIMAPKVKTVAAIFKVLIADCVQNRFDPITVPLSWDEDLYKSVTPLRIGYFTSLSFFPALGDTPDTVLNAKEMLESLGHTLVPMELPHVDQLVEAVSALISADGGNQIYKKLKHDQISPVAEKFTYGRTWLSNIILQIILKFRKPIKTEFPFIPVALRSESLWKYLAMQRDLKYRILDEMKDLNIDLILSPVFPFPASKVEDTDTLIGGCAYTVIWNLLDFPSGVVPFGKESGDKIDDFDDEGNYYMKLAKRGIKQSINMPIGVQIIGKPFKDELVLRVLQQLDENYHANNV